ncbi:MAG TPA: carbohydrate ABC transporter permease [Clostridiaceae bacterium]|nr:carbohydrate ABC transporter permease [Clostridiaceae bacterium]
MKERRTIGDIFWRLMLFLWALGIILPMIWVLYESLKTNREFYKDIWALPEQTQWNNYAKAWNYLGLGKGMLNTVYYVGCSLFFGISFTALCAYALTRLQWKGKRLAWNLLMLSLLLPGINAIVPQYVIARSLHLTGKLSGLIFLNSAVLDIFSLMVVSGFMQTIPTELEESAFMDGASLFQVFRLIIVPLSMPGIVTISIFRFLALYNDFLGPYIYLSDKPEKYTIGVSMFMANQQMIYKSDWVSLFAGVIIAMIPTIIIYLIFQKTVTQGATLGAIKG